MAEWNKRAFEMEQVAGSNPGWVSDIIWEPTNTQTTSDIPREYILCATKIENKPGVKFSKTYNKLK